MDRPAFRALLRQVDLTADEFAALVGVNRSTVRGWGARYPIPYHARLILELLIERGGIHGLLGREPVTRCAASPVVQGGEG